MPYKPASFKACLIAATKAIYLGMHQESHAENESMFLIDNYLVDLGLVPQNHETSSTYSYMILSQLYLGILHFTQIIRRRETYLTTSLRSHSFIHYHFDLPNNVR